jgi:STE24 endopeptidase
MEVGPSAGPPRRRNLTVRRVGLGLAVIGWLVAAYLLSDTVVPDDLSLPSIDVQATFGRELVHDAEAYERIPLLLWVLTQITLVVTFWVYARRGAVLTRESAAGPIGTGMLLGMLGLALTWAVQLPFGLARLWWDRRHDVSEVGYFEWALGGWAELTASFISICVALLIVMALARAIGEWWWIPGAAVFVGIAFTFAATAPLLTSDLHHPTNDPKLIETYDRLAAAENVHGVPLKIEDVSGDTSQANAYAFGVAGTQQIVLWDTLLDGRFSDGEVAVVLAHELGHHSSGHIAEAIEWFALFAFPGAWLLMRVTRRRGGMGTPEAVPLALLVITLFSLASSPLQNWVSRRMESEADWKALTTTRDPTSAKQLFEGFSQTSLGDPSPPTWAYLMLSTHPTLAQRVAMVEAWEKTTTPSP